MTVKVTMAAALCGVFVISGCSEPGSLGDPNDPHRNRNQGIAIGAGIGALVGQIAGGDKEATLAGAVAGGIAGGLLGADLDRQEADLRASLGDGRIRITNTGDRLIVTMPQDILFDTDSFTVRPSLRSDLQAVASNLRAYPNSTVQVIGHTDNTGEAAYNQDLSERRARAVASEIISGGVPSSRIVTVGRGEDQPVASNLTPEGRALNRRVDIVILPTR